MDISGGLANSLGLYNPYQAPLAPTQTTNYQDYIQKAMAGQLGPDRTQSNADRARQIALVNAMTASANGQGPSLSGQLLQNATNQNMQNSASLLGSQRGMSPALTARLIAQSNANIQQQSAGQAATNQMQEQLGNRAALAQALSGMRGQDIGQATTDSQTNLAALGTAGGLQNQQNSTAVQNQSQANQINSGVAASNQQQKNAVTGGIMNTVGSMLGGLFAEGGEVPHFAGGGGMDPISGLFSNLGKNITAANVPQPLVQNGGGDSKSDSSSSDPLGAIKKIFGGGASPAASSAPNAVGTPALGDIGGMGASDLPALGGAAMMAAKGGSVPCYDEGGIIGTAMKLAPLALMALAKSGGKVPGKASVPGNSLKNDTYPAMLSPGEIVLPRTVTQAPDADDKAKEFVSALKKKGKAGGIPERNGGYAKVLESHRQLHDRLSKLESMMGAA